MNPVCAHAHSGPSRGLAGGIGQSRQGIVGQGVQAVTAGILLREADEELRRRRQLLPRRPVQQHGAPEHRTDRSGHKAEAPGQQDGKASGQGDARAGGRQGKRRCLWCTVCATGQSSSPPAPPAGYEKSRGSSELRLLLSVFLRQKRKKGLRFRKP